MNHWILGLKREYWEYKKILIAMPFLVSAMFFLVAIIYTWTHHASNTDTVLSNNGMPFEMAIDSERSEVDDSPAPESESNKDEDQNKNSDKEQFWFSGVYLAAAWLAAMFYALSSLYNDRRDKSILYWKTMPVSELQNVLTKMTFAIIGFSVAAIAVSLVSSVVLMTYAHLVFPPEMIADDSAGMSLSKLVLWPVLTVLVAIPWCAPVFALLLYVSARARKMPILILVVSAFLVRMFEKVVFSSSHIVDFFMAHSPLTLLARVSEMNSAADILSTYLFASLPSLMLGLLIAALFVWRAAWCRDNKFETS